VRAITLTADDVAWLLVLLDNAVPREPGGQTDWEGTGRRVAESILGYRERCRCEHVPDEGTTFVPGCPIHDRNAVAAGERSNDDVAGADRGGRRETAGRTYLSDGVNTATSTVDIRPVRPRRPGPYPPSQQG